MPFAWVAADAVYGVGDVEQALRRACKGYVLGVKSDHHFGSWSGKPAVAGTAAEIARDLEPGAWQRLSAGEGTKGGRLHDWVYCELADLDADEYDDTQSGLWTRGLLIRRNISDGDLAFFTTWCPAGTDIQADTYDIQIKSGTLAPSTAAAASLFPSRTDLAFGGRADAIIQLTPRLELTPGIRLDLFTSDGSAQLGADPRLAMRTTVTNRVKILAAMGIAHQAPAFVVPVPGFQPGGLDGGLQKSYQTSAGAEVDLGGQTIATANVYHNAFYDLSDPLGATQPDIGGCPPGSFPSDVLGGDRASQPTRTGNCNPPFAAGTLGPDRTGGGGQGAESMNSQRNSRALSVRTTGNAYGFELMVKRKLTSRIGGFLSYTLSRSTRTGNNQTYIASFDRTHVVNAAIAFDLGRNWRAGTRVTFYTGLPKQPDPTSDSTRLSPFFRLDLRLEKRWQLSQKAWISFVAEAMNVTLSKEAVSTECTLEGCNEQTIGPVTIPSLGIEGGF